MHAARQLGCFAHSLAAPIALYRCVRSKHDHVATGAAKTRGWPREAQPAAAVAVLAVAGGFSGDGSVAGEAGRYSAAIGCEMRAAVKLKLSCPLPACCPASPPRCAEALDLPAVVVGGGGAPCRGRQGGALWAAPCAAAAQAAPGLPGGGALGCPATRPSQEPGSRVHPLQHCECVHAAYRSASGA